MVKNYLLSLLLLLLCTIGNNVSAHDIAIPNADGVTIYYNYINNNTELAVTLAGDWYGYVNNEYSGVVVIPEEVILEERTLKVTRIENNAFWECTSLSSVTIGNNVTTIGNEAFYGCSSLKSITIPKSVTHIGNNVFFNCPNLNAVHISDLEAWCNIHWGGDFYSRYHLYLNGEEIKNLIIPESVTCIGSYAFAKCYRLLSITIPNGVTSIGHHAFEWCSNLQNIYCNAEQVPETGNNVFANYDATLHVPATSVSAYQAAEQWKDFKEIVALPERETDYRPFVEEGKVWQVGAEGSGNPVQIVEYYYFDGDTIIDGKACKQMMCQRFVSPDSPKYDAYSQQPSLNYVGAWYEEDKKVYEYDSIRKQFTMLYDFSLEDNGTFLTLGQYYVVGPRQTGGMKGFKGVYRDVTPLLDGINNITWMEGVGGTDRPTTNVYSSFDSNIYPLWFLMACAVDDEVIYLNDEYEDGATPENMGAQKRRFDFTHTTKLQPKVPMRREAEQSLYGEYNDKLLGINLEPVDEAYLVRITDETGKVVYEKAIDAGNIVALNVDISSYARGRYTVSVENSQESFTGQFETKTTGIEEISSKRSEVRDYIYNLQGQRLTSLQKGLNIVNGKKVYVK